MNSTQMALVSCDDLVCGEVDRAAVSAVMKRCACCTVVKPVGEFWANKANLDGLYNYCKPCTSWACKKYRFGMTSSQFRLLHEAQGYRCGICRVPLADTGHDGVNVDHLGKTGQRCTLDKVRGFLCQKCNVYIGVNDALLYRLRHHPAAAAYVTDPPAHRWLGTNGWSGHV